MANMIKKNDSLYLDALAWMGYRYAMGMTDYVGEKGYSPMDLFLTFVTENGINFEEGLSRYESITVEVARDGQISYKAEMKPESEESKSSFWPNSSIDDYLGWDALASFFYPKCQRLVGSWTMAKRN